MTKYQMLVEKVVVTFFQAGIAYVAVAPHVQWDKTLIAGALGAGLSAVYNLLRESKPTTIVTPLVTPTTFSPIEPPIIPTAPPKETVESTPAVLVETPIEAPVVTSETQA
jgi:hypothetical protein